MDGVDQPVARLSAGARHHRAPRRRKLELHVETLLAAEQVSLSRRTRVLTGDQRAEWRELDRRILAFDKEFALQARTDDR